MDEDAEAEEVDLECPAEKNGEGEAIADHSEQIIPSIFAMRLIAFAAACRRADCAEYVESSIDISEQFERTAQGIRTELKRQKTAASAPPSAQLCFQGLHRVGQGQSSPITRKADGTHSLQTNWSKLSTRQEQSVERKSHRVAGH